MTEQPPVEKKGAHSSWWVNLVTAAAGALATLVAVVALIGDRWDKSNTNSEEIGRLKATLRFNEDQLKDYQKRLSDSQRDLDSVQNDLQKTKIELHAASSDMRRLSERNSDLEGFIQALQVQNTNLRESERRADSCRPIQKRITEIENKIELSGGAFGGYSPHQLEDARQQLADHQASLRTCLSRAR